MKALILILLVIFSSSYSWAALRCADSFNSKDWAYYLVGPSKSEQAQAVFNNNSPNAIILNAAKKGKNQPEEKETDVDSSGQGDFYRDPWIAPEGSTGRYDEGPDGYGGGPSWDAPRGGGGSATDVLFNGNQTRSLQMKNKGKDKSKGNSERDRDFYITPYKDTGNGKGPHLDEPGNGRTDYGPDAVYDPWSGGQGSATDVLFNGNQTRSLQMKNKGKDKSKGNSERDRDFYITPYKDTGNGKGPHLDEPGNGRTDYGPDAVYDPLGGGGGSATGVLFKGSKTPTTQVNRGLNSVQYKASDNPIPGSRKWNDIQRGRIPRPGEENVLQIPLESPDIYQPSTPSSTPTKSERGVWQTNL